ncbi:hypothetical protein [Pseudoalteromonas luteoviolacea]|uniref:Uncharacterized protein n=1 Tax=Pseudoalteromonas luteoviolacea S4060-1 TaxID=1365257 RepID=A0A167JR06_9GAMM|nr:hypothetical protein [Pseudoalteromonas luteoviolacea]KZN61535.1 hypothetical protein N478_05530 [Pseudoalteromonas luteoviolacea S4060-1]
MGLIIIGSLIIVSMIILAIVSIFKSHSNNRLEILLGKYVKESKVYTASNKARYDDREYQLGKAHVIVMNLGEALEESDYLKQIEDVRTIHESAINYRNNALSNPVLLQAKEVRRPILRVINK